MIAQMMKIAGVKSPEALLKKFPTEEAFMKKYSKEFKLAQDGLTAIDQDMDVAQVGASYPNIMNNYQPKPFGNSFSAKYGNIQQPNFSMDQPQPGGDPVSMAGNAAMAGGFEPGFTSGSFSNSDIGSFNGAVGVAGKIVDGIEGIREEKKQLKRSRQGHAVSDVSLAAARTRPEQYQRQYYRPEDIEKTGEELFPIYGVGTNAIAQDGQTVNQRGRLPQDTKYINLPNNKSIVRTQKGIGSEVQNTMRLYYSDGSAGNYTPNDMMQVRQTPQWGEYEKEQQKQLILEGRIKPNFTDDTMFSGKKYAGDMQDGGQVFNDDDGDYEVYEDVDYEPMQNGGMVNPIYDKIGGFADNMSGYLYGQNAGSDLGGTLGGAAGSFFGPGGKLVGEQVGKLAGWALDRNPAKIKKENDAMMRNMGAMAGMGVGASVQGQYNNIVQNGGELGDGELQTLWGGEAELASYNPYSPGSGETIEFKGDMHNGNPTPGKSGIGIRYGDSNIEVEHGEQASVLEDENGQENLTVFGNLKIPKNMLADTKAGGKKFKNYVKDISDKEEKSNKHLEKNLTNIEDLEVLTSFDKLKLNSFNANVLGNNMKLKDLAIKKQDAASLQKSINETAQEWGVVADDLARGKLKVDKGVFVPSNQRAQFGADLPIYKDGGEEPFPKYDPNAPKKTLKIKKEQIAAYVKEGWIHDPKTKTLRLPGKAAVVHVGTPGKAATATSIGGKTTTVIKPAVPGRRDNYDGKGGYMSNEKWNAFLKTPAGIKYTAGLKGTPAVTQEIVSEASQASPAVPAIPGYIDDPTPDQTAYYEEGGKGKFDAIGMANALLPMWRPTNQTTLDPNDLYGEMFALSHNQVEPVHAQGYKPELDVPYDISLQDQLNGVTSQTRATQRMAGYNPAAQAAIAGQAYDPYSKILGEQFRFNQAKKDQVYSGNRATLNEAQKANLGIYADQAHKQSQARSNTKEATQLALNSISDKYSKLRLENKTLGVYENMYNYRYTNKGRAVNMNPIAQWDTEYKGGGSQQGASKQEQIYAYEQQIKKLKGGLKKENDTTDNDPEIMPIKQNGGKILNKMPLVKALKHY